MIAKEQTKSALLTGGKGFIGQHLKRSLVERGWAVDVWPYDIRSIASFEKTVDVVFHLAAITREKRFLDEYWLDSFDVNVTGTQAVLNYCQKNKAQCIFASTSAVYSPNTLPQKISENYQTKPLTLYGKSKLLAENLCRRFAEDFGGCAVALRIFNVFGPGQKEPFLVPYIINRIAEGGPIYLRMPDAVCDFVYISDVVEAMIKASTSHADGFATYNIGSGLATKVIDFLEIAEQIFGVKGEIEIDEREQKEIPITVANNSKAIKELGWEVKVDLRSGLLQMK